MIFKRKVIIMEMNFRNLVEVLGIDAPVHFTPKDKLDKQNYVFVNLWVTTKQPQLL